MLSYYYDPCMAQIYVWYFKIKQTPTKRNDLKLELLEILANRNIASKVRLNHFMRIREQLISGEHPEARHHWKPRLSLLHKGFNAVFDKNTVSGSHLRETLKNEVVFERLVLTFDQYLVVDEKDLSFKALIKATATNKIDQILGYTKFHLANKKIDDTEVIKLIRLVYSLKNNVTPSLYHYLLNELYRINAPFTLQFFFNKNIQDRHVIITDHDYIEMHLVGLNLIKEFAAPDLTSSNNVIKCPIYSGHHLIILFSLSYNSVRNYLNDPNVKEDTFEKYTLSRALQSLVAAKQEKSKPEEKHSPAANKSPLYSVRSTGRKPQFLNSPEELTSNDNKTLQFDNMFERVKGLLSESIKRINPELGRIRERESAIQNSLNLLNDILGCMDKPLPAFLTIICRQILESLTILYLQTSADDNTWKEGHMGQATYSILVKNAIDYQERVLFPHDIRNHPEAREFLCNLLDPNHKHSSVYPNGILAADGVAIDLITKFSSYFDLKELRSVRSGCATLDSENLHWIKNRLLEICPNLYTVIQHCFFKVTIYDKELIEASYKSFNLQEKKKLFNALNTHLMTMENAFNELDAPTENSEAHLALVIFRALLETSLSTDELEALYDNYLPRLDYNIDRELKDCFQSRIRQLHAQFTKYIPSDIERLEAHENFLELARDSYQQAVILKSQNVSNFRLERELSKKAVCAFAMYLEQGNDLILAKPLLTDLRRLNYIDKTLYQTWANIIIPMKPREITVPKHWINWSKKESPGITESINPTRKKFF